MKIKKIEVQNFKAIDSQVMNFDGCSAIVTAGNNKGKSSLLRGLIDRFRSEKPEIIVKEGEQKGFNIIELTDGSFVEWKFTEKTESFSFITKEGIKQTQGVLKTIGEKYFGINFDIDKFLSSGAKKQSETLQKLVGLDFSELDSRYKEAYENRTFVNRQFSEISAQKVEKPIVKEFREIGIIKKEISEIKEQNAKALALYNSEKENNRLMVDSENDKLRTEWNIENDKHLRSIYEFNSAQKVKEEKISRFQYEYDAISNTISDNFKDLFDWKAANDLINSLPNPEPLKESTQIKQPEYKTYSILEKPIEKTFEHLETELENAQRYFAEFNLNENKYNDWIEKGKIARKEKEDAEKLISEIQAEKLELIKGAKMPKGFEFSEDSILYNGLPLTSNQLSSSAKYIAGLKLGLMVLGEVRTMHFDASFLDKNSLAEVQEWAVKNDLQLLIERPDFDGGEIKFEII